jgi:catechol 2,3-dioxygenase-like lactoylglutathione lyase family enzyme
MQLGAFSVSLSVKDIHASKAFYEKLGFTQFGGDPEHNWVIMKNGDHLIGLFQGMFEGNILTFNPGWDQNAGEVKNFSDVRSIYGKLSDAGIELEGELDLKGEGPGSFVLKDPDGNSIMFDQHR